MIHLTAATPIRLAREPADFRLGIDGLVARCQQHLHQDPRCGTLYIFTRRKFFDLHVNHRSQIAAQALEFFARLYRIEAEVAAADEQTRRQSRQAQARPLLDALRTWLIGQRQNVPPGAATAKAIDYSLRRWAALCRYLDDPQVPIDNNAVENRIRPVALGRSNWLFAGSLRAGQRAMAIMSLIQSAKLNGLDPYLYLKDVLQRLPALPARRLHELLPHRWQPASSDDGVC